MSAILDPSDRSEVAVRGLRDAHRALPPTLAQRFRYRLRLSLREPTTAIGALTALLFGYLIVVPIISMLLDAMRVQIGDERRTKQDIGELTWY